VKLITNKGGSFSLGEISPAVIHPEDIAIALSRLCRFCGHGRRFYSVGEHSIRLASMVPDRFKLEALLHDAAEAYVGDLSAAVRPFVQQFDRLELRVYAQIAKKFGIPARVSPVVDEADLEIRGFELFELFGVSLNTGDPSFCAPVDFPALSPDLVSVLWLELLSEYWGAR
jgi:hypothetical protein